MPSEKNNTVIIIQMSNVRVTTFKNIVELEVF